MAKVTFKRYETNAEAIASNVVDGQFIITKEGNSYIDYGTTRVPTNGTLDNVMSDTSTNGVQNKIIKGYVDGKITTNINESGNVVPTCETVKDYVDTKSLEVYSSTEQVVGTYDGKPLYRKLYKVTSITTGSYQTIALDSTYRVKRYEGYLHRTNGRVDSFVGNGNYDYLPLLATIRTTGIEYYVGSTYGTGAESVDFIIEYTKTTD